MRSVSLKKFEAFKRFNLELGFDVYKTDAGSQVLARIPMFIRYPGARGLSPNSKLARLFHVLYTGQAPPRWGRMNGSALKHKLWRGVVVDATKDTTDGSLPENLRYSVVAYVTERLA